MAASLDMRPDTTVTAKLTFTHIEVDGADANEADGTEKRYRLVASHDADEHDPLTSHLFNVNGGKHVWDNVLFPVAGAWTVDLVDQADDSVAATLAVTVE